MIESLRLPQRLIGRSTDMCRKRHAGSDPGGAASWELAAKEDFELKKEALLADRDFSLAQAGVCALRFAPFASCGTGSEGRREKRRGAGSRQFLNGDVKKDVDEARKSLHNLVSLLLTQKRRKRRAVTQ
ncbi:hypothetical protein [Paraburkholderia pallida]|uniref:Uncharacterized protein n=1 Tax=Paraburkholderia pallida TaxID=2547399 RepID=A0A4P7D1R0_9BURK|nr:hypothetical protein [Paraburkholderia pallida]QBR02546.1 hypothetical protein E1956_35515 [Paraburkholderia pallida]